MTSAEGLWLGGLSPATSMYCVLDVPCAYAMNGVVLDDGTYWFLYRVGKLSIGMLQGNSISDNGAFNSSDGIDLNFELISVRPVAIVSSYVAKEMMDGTVSYPKEPNNFAISINALYDTNYDVTPNISALAGAYSGETAIPGATDTISLTISSAGAISGSTGLGCTFTGTTALRHGNVYDLSVTFAGGSCLNGTDTLTGVAFHNAIDLDRGFPKTVFMAALNNSRTKGFLFVGCTPRETGCNT